MEKGNGHKDSSDPEVSKEANIAKTGKHCSRESTLSSFVLFSLSLSLSLYSFSLPFSLKFYLRLSLVVAAASVKIHTYQPTVCRA
jgi:hypothetical protein